MSAGGSRPGAGRKRGAARTKTSEIANRAALQGLTPLEYLLARMRDDKEDPKVRVQCARDAAPYIHPKLAAIEHSGPAKGPIEISHHTPEEAYMLMINGS